MKSERTHSGGRNGDAGSDRVGAEGLERVQEPVLTAMPEVVWVPEGHRAPPGLAGLLVVEALRRHGQRVLVLFSPPHQVARVRPPVQDVFGDGMGI